MSKGDHIEMEGIVEKALGGGWYHVRVKDNEGNQTESTVRAKVSGRSKRHHIRVLAGDRVKVSVSPYDLTHGMITWRYR